MNENSQNDNKEMSLIDKIKDKLGMSIKHLTTDRDLEGENANASYMMSTYGEILTDEERKNKFIRSTNTTIQYKTAMHEFHCTSQIPLELVKYKDFFIERYTKQGYVCIDLADKLKDTDLGYHVLFISWYGCY
jgi:hypothetical protein